VNIFSAANELCIDPRRVLLIRHAFFLMFVTVSEGTARFVGSSDTPQQQNNFDATQLELASVA
jgi:hypothetical protein